MHVLLGVVAAMRDVADNGNLHGILSIVIVVVRVLLKKKVQSCAQMTEQASCRIVSIIHNQHLYHSFRNEKSEKNNHIYCTRAQNSNQNVYFLNVSNYDVDQSYLDINERDKSEFTEIYNHVIPHPFIRTSDICIFSQNLMMESVDHEPSLESHPTFKYLEFSILQKNVPMLFLELDVENHCVPQLLAMEANVEQLVLHVTGKVKKVLEQWNQVLDELKKLNAMTDESKYVLNYFSLENRNVVIGGTQHQWVCPCSKMEDLTICLSFIFELYSATLLKKQDLASLEKQFAAKHSTLFMPLSTIISKYSTGVLTALVDKSPAILSDLWPSPSIHITALLTSEFPTSTEAQRYRSDCFYSTNNSVKILRQAFENPQDNPNSFSAYVCPYHSSNSDMRIGILRTFNTLKSSSMLTSCILNEYTISTDFAPTPNPYKLDVPLSLFAYDFGIGNWVPIAHDASIQQGAILQWTTKYQAKLSFKSGAIVNNELSNVSTENLLAHRFTQDLYETSTVFCQVEPAIPAYTHFQSSCFSKFALTSEWVSCSDSYFRIYGINWDHYSIVLDSFKRLLKHQLKENGMDDVDFSKLTRVIQSGVFYRESVRGSSQADHLLCTKSPNRHNRIYSTMKSIVDSSAQLLGRGWIQGTLPGKPTKPNDLLLKVGRKNALVVNVIVQPQSSFHEWRDFMLTVLSQHSKFGFLCELPMYGVQYTIEHYSNNSDSIHRGGGQIFPMVKRNLIGATLFLSPCLLEPVQKVWFRYFTLGSKNSSVTKEVTRELLRRQAKVSLDQEHHTSLLSLASMTAQDVTVHTILCSLPTRTAKNFKQDLQIIVSGELIKIQQFSPTKYIKFYYLEWLSHFSFVQGNVFEEGSESRRIVNEHRVQLGLPPLPPNKEALVDQYLDKF